MITITQAKVLRVLVERQNEFAECRLIQDDLLNSGTIFKGNAFYNLMHRLKSKGLVEDRFRIDSVGKCKEYRVTLTGLNELDSFNRFVADWHDSIPSMKMSQYSSGGQN